MKLTGLTTQETTKYYTLKLKRYRGNKLTLKETNDFGKLLFNKKKQQKSLVVSI